MTVAERFDHIILVVSLCSLGAMMIMLYVAWLFTNVITLPTKRADNPGSCLEI